MCVAVHSLFFRSLPRLILPLPAAQTLRCTLRRVQHTADDTGNYERSKPKQGTPVWLRYLPNVVESVSNLRRFSAGRRSEECGYRGGRTRVQGTTSEECAPRTTSKASCNLRFFFPALCCL